MCVQVKEITEHLSHLSTLISASDSHQIDLDRLLHMLDDLLSARSTRSMFESIQNLPSQSAAAQGSRPMHDMAPSATPSQPTHDTAVAGRGHSQLPHAYRLGAHGAQRQHTLSIPAIDSATRAQWLSGSVMSNGNSSLMEGAGPGQPWPQAWGVATASEMTCMPAMHANGTTSSHHMPWQTSHQTVPQESNPTAAAQSPHHRHSVSAHARPLMNQVSDCEGRSASRAGSSVGASSTWSTIVAPPVGGSCSRERSVEPRAGEAALQRGGSSRRGCESTSQGAGGDERRGNSAGGGAGWGGREGVVQPNWVQTGLSMAHVNPTWAPAGSSRLGATQCMRIRPEVQTRSGSQCTVADENFITVGVPTHHTHDAVRNTEASDTQHTRHAQRRCMGAMHDSVHDSAEGLSGKRIAAYHVGSLDSSDGAHSTAASVSGSHDASSTHHHASSWQGKGRAVLSRVASARESNSACGAILV